MSCSAFRLALVATLVAACGGSDQDTADSTVVDATDSPQLSPAALSALPMRALGTEPFWALDIDTASLRFITPEDTAGSRFGTDAPTVTGDTTVWTGRNGQSIEVRVWPEQCSDGMSDREYPFAVRVTLGGTRYRGCADRRSVIAPR